MISCSQTVCLLPQKAGRLTATTRLRIMCRFFSTVVSDPSLVDASLAPPDYDYSAVVYPNMIDKEESDALVDDLLTRLKRRRYERGHWDAAIIKYKETELADESSLSPVSQNILARVRSHLLEHHISDERKQQNHGVRWLPCHGIDLHENGELNAHVDSARFSGDLVCGLSLLSDSIMRLRPDPEQDDPDRGHIDLYLPMLSLYVLSNQSRYHYSHEILPSGSKFGGNAISRGHRLSVIFRDARPCDATTDDD